MNREEINQAIVSLAHSKGFYGRLIAGNYGDYDEILDWLHETVRPSDALDIVMALEC